MTGGQDDPFNWGQKQVESSSSAEDSSSESQQQEKDKTKKKKPDDAKTKTEADDEEQNVRVKKVPTKVKIEGHVKMEGKAIEIKKEVVDLEKKENIEIKKGSRRLGKEGENSCGFDRRL